MKTILIPTDFSDNALHALKYAQALYKCDRACFFILHAYGDEAYSTHHADPNSDLEQVKREIRGNAERKLDQVLDSVIGLPPNPLHNFELIATMDSLVDGVNSLVEEINMDLVVMGTKGETSDYKGSFGSKTVEVFKYVKCPVLAVPMNYEPVRPKNILFPTDYMVPYKRRELKLLDNLGGEFKSKIHCLYITDFDELAPRQLDNKKFLERSLSRSYLSFGTAPVKNRAEVILEYVELNKADLLVMVNSRHSYIEDMLYRSTVDLMALKLNIPLLVMQNLFR